MKDDSPVGRRPGDGPSGRDERFRRRRRARRRARLLALTAVVLVPLLAVAAVFALVTGGAGRAPEEVAGDESGGEQAPREEAVEEEAPEAPAEAPAEPAPAEVGADESGLVMVLQYHRVGGDPSFAPEWTISAEDFRAQLEYLHENDYHPINFRDLVQNRVDVPAGKTPVVLTFDDSSDTQFTMIRKDGGWVPDPEGAVGVLQDFHEEHPDWPMRATFFVLPAAEPPNDFFGQPELTRQKLRFLVDAGMEIGTHTLWHANLAESPPELIQEQIALSIVEIQEHLPNYEVDTLGVPFGAYPQDISLIQAGSWQGMGYELDGAVEVAGGASYPPGHEGFDPYRVPRIQAEPMKEQAAYLFEHFEQNPNDRYVSDGDPDTVTVPRGGGEGLNRAVLEAAGKTVREYAPE